MAAVQKQNWKTVGAPLALVLAGATALSVAISAPLAQAQDAGHAPHPAHIHSGTCDNLGDIVYPLTDVRENTAGESFGASDAVVVETSETDVDAALSAILGEPHAINIHESADNIQNYIACGNIGGRVVDGDLLIGLNEVNGSGYRGVAELDADDDDDDDDVEVYVYLANFGEAAGAEPPAAAPADDAAADAAATDDATAADDAAPAADAVTPATEAPAAEAAAPAAEAAVEVPVDIRDFAYGPNPVEVPVGGTVTWTNQDAVPHTATADQRDVLQSGTISPGSSFSQVFDTAGEFNYFCEFHPNMSGTIVVQ